MRPRAARLSALLSLVLVAPAGAQEPAKPRDALLAEVDELLKQAQREIREFEQAGGERGEARHPVGRWVTTLWEIRDRHPGTAASGRATTEAIHLLVHAGRLAEARERADGLGAGDPAWASLGPVLFEAASAAKDHEFLVRKLSAVLEHQADASVRAALRYHLGRGRWKKGDLDGATAAFVAVLQEAPGSSTAKDAEAALYELKNLGYGQVAPVFSAKARDGSPVSLADYRGRVVLLVFWTTT